MSDDSKAIVPVRQGLVVAISRQMGITEKLLLQIPAEQGDAEAQYKLGVLYEDEGYPDEAVKWYCMAAEKGHAGAQCRLGQFINSGFGFCEPEEYAEAAKWFRKAAEQGHAEAQYRLGGAYSLGEGVPEDDVEATKWYLKAAEQGHADAQYSLGHHYWLAGFWEEPKSNGLFEDSLFEELLGELNKERVSAATRDYIQAVKWYRKAADQGHAGAQNGLGEMYENGRGISRDYIQAAKWYRKAAKQGDFSAQHNLGKLYSSGRGVSQDNVRALMWLNLAAEHMYSKFPSRDRLEEDRDELIEKMTPAQIAEAQGLAGEWKRQRLLRLRAMRKAEHE